MTSPGADRRPPGYVAPGEQRDVRYSAPRPQLTRLVHALAVLLPVSAALGVVSGFASFRRANLIDDVLDGRDIDLAAVDAADSLVQTLSAIHLLTYLPTGIVFIVWFWRLAKNAALLDRHGAPRAGWAFWSWFVPIGSLWLPAENLLRADRVSGQVLDGGITSNRRLVVSWAAAFAIGSYGSAILWRSVPVEILTGRDLATFVRADRYDVVLQVVVAVAAVLAVLMVRRLTERQDRAFDDLEAADQTRAMRNGAVPATPAEPPAEPID